MKKWFLFFIPMILSLFAVQTTAQNQRQVDFPEVPRVSAYEAYAKYKNGKTIILHASGEKYNRRHITGAINVSAEELGKDTHLKLIQKLPKEGIEIFTYCY